MSSYTSIPAAELGHMMATGTAAILIDVRTPAEFDSVHAAGAQLMPLDKLSPEAAGALRKDAGEPLYFMCRTDRRSKTACASLAAAGVANIVRVEGGTVAWEEAGLPVQRGKSVMSLERQVRIVAGTLVIIGVTLALTVHWGFIGISAFIGVGLVFAGVTDFCGMGLLLAKMPWNQRRGCKT